MRNAFASEITELAARDERVVLLSGDIGNRLFDDFKRRFPGRFHNCGVAEANMVSLAAGMALCGLRPVTYTIAAFAVTRCLEQIRVDLCYHDAPVTIVGVGAGLSYAENGATHHACEDIALMRALPNMRVLCPADVTELRLLLPAALVASGPSYLRLGKKGELAVHVTPPRLAIGQGIVLAEGREVCLVATGNAVALAVQAAGAMERDGLACGVVSFPSVKPLDEALLGKLATQYDLVATLEEHSVIGGLGSAVAEWWAGCFPAVTARLVVIGTPDRFLHGSGRQAHARTLVGLTPEAIAQTITRAHRKVVARSNP